MNDSKKMNDLIDFKNLEIKDFGIFMYFLSDLYKYEDLFIFPVSLHILLHDLGRQISIILQQLP